MKAWFVLPAIVLLVTACTGVASPSRGAPASAPASASASVSLSSPVSLSSGATQSSTVAASTPGATVSPTPSGRIVGSFTVNGHSLFLLCSGTGSPTVIYLHGMAQSASDTGLEHADGIAAELEGRYRICRYDRVNVGSSGAIHGRQTAADAVHDLANLLGEAHVPGPYLLLGASFGGLIAYEFAVLHPQHVVGMVLLDPTLPREYLDIDPYYHPDGGQLTGQEWKDNKEHMDWLGSMREAAALEGQEPKIPVTYIALEHPETWWHPVTPASIAAYRAMQQRFVNLWSPGTMLILDVPHYMEPVIPGRIAEEVEKVAQGVVP